LYPGIGLQLVITRSKYSGILKQPKGDGSGWPFAVFTKKNVLIPWQLFKQPFHLQNSIYFTTT